MNKTAWKFQKGLSLVELMVAMTLTIIVAAAMISLFINAKQNYRINENMSRLQENARYAVTYIARDLRMADYRPCVNDDRLDNAIDAENDSGFNGSDKITIRWQVEADDDCSNNNNTTRTTIYQIKTGAKGGPSLFRSIDGTDRELVEGIENLQFVFGEDTDADDIPNYYVDAGDVSEWEQAVTTRFNLIARTLESNITTDGNRITRPFTSTITLRNRIP